MHIGKNVRRKLIHTAAHLRFQIILEPRPIGLTEHIVYSTCKPVPLNRDISVCIFIIRLIKIQQVGIIIVVLTDHKPYTQIVHFSRQVPIHLNHSETCCFISSLMNTEIHIVKRHIGNICCSEYSINIVAVFNRNGPDEFIYILLIADVTQ